MESEVTSAAVVETAIPRWPGLSSHEAAARLKAEGLNELPRAERRTFVRIAVDVAREPMFGLLLAAGIIYLALGDLGGRRMIKI